MISCPRYLLIRCGDNKIQAPRGLSETLSGMFIKYVDERSVISNVYNHPCVDKVVIRVANELK